MLEDLKNELPYLLKQYSRKKEELSKKVFDELDEEEKSLIKKHFQSFDDMQTLSSGNGAFPFIEPDGISENEKFTLIKIFVSIPRSYMFDEFVREMSLVYMITVFESYLESVLTTTFEKRPECLSSSKMISFEEVVANLKSNEVLNALIGKEIDEVLRKDIEKINEYFLQKFKVTLSEFVPDWNEFKERFYRRNIIVHNMGMVNEEYRRKTGHRGKEKKLTVSEEYLNKSFEMFEEISKKIMFEFYGKFEQV